MFAYIFGALLLIEYHIVTGVIDCPDSWITYEDSCYLFETQKENFTSAKKYCEFEDAHLLHVGDSNENKFIRDWLTKLKPSIWYLGLTDNVTENTWLWTDTGVSPVFTDWHPGQPDNGGHNQDCAVYHKGMTFDWDDEFCTNQYCFICELGESVGSVIVG